MMTPLSPRISPTGTPGCRSCARVASEKVMPPPGCVGPGGLVRRGVEVRPPVGGHQLGLVDVEHDRAGPAAVQRDAVVVPANHAVICCGSRLDWSCHFSPTMLPGFWCRV